MAGLTDLQVRKDHEALEILTGARGDGTQAALRRGDFPRVEEYIAELRKSAAGVGERIATLQGQIDTLQGELDTAVGDLGTLQDAIDAINAGLGGLSAISPPAVTATVAAGATPTKTEFDKVVTDLNASSAVILAILTALTP